MANSMTRDQVDKIAAGIRQKYSEVAKSPEGQFQYTTGRKGLEALNYDKTLIDKLPDAVASTYCGVGNPFSLGKINEGEHVLDIGCGAGVDTILAAMMAGSNGSAVGVDIVPEMIARAESNLKTTGIDNVSFQTTDGEHLPFPDDIFDVVISNGAINLIPDKERALAEINRVLKPGGRLMVADQIAVGSVQKDIEARLVNWFQ
jgi:SAM-dependent methyltransferase